MVTILNNSRQGGGLGSGLGGLGGGSNQITSEDLVNIARLRGGAVGEVAENLYNPKTSFFSTISSSGLNALSKTIDVLQTGLYGVTGALSDDYTIREAIAKGVTPSEAFMKRLDPDATRGEKTVDFVKRFALDTLLDPLTYVTFGASTGALGVTKGLKLTIGAKAAKEMGKRTVKLAGDNESAVAFLSKEGEELAQRYVKAQSDGLRHTNLINERVRRVNEGYSPEEAFRLAKKNDDEMSDFMIREALDKPLDPQWAAKRMSKLLEYRPHLANTLLDKGGIKFFGMSMLSSQKISTVAGLIPGSTLLDNAMTPIRNTVLPLFNRNYTSSGRLPEEIIKLEQKVRNMAETQKNQMIKALPRIYKKLNITANESKFITAAVETGIMPLDAKASDVWKAVNGIMPDSGTIRPEVWTGVREIQGQLKKNMRMLRDSGAPVSSYMNYFPHYLVKNKDINDLAFLGKGGNKYVARGEKEARVFSLIDEKTGDRMSVAVDKMSSAGDEITARTIKEGVESRKKFRYIREIKDSAQIRKIANEKEEALKKEMAKISAEAVALRGAATTSIAAQTTDQIVKRMKDVTGIDKADKEAITEAVSKYIKDTDIDSLVTQRVRNFYKDGIKLKGGTTVSNDEVEDIIAALSAQKVMSKQQGKQVLSQVNKVLNAKPRLPHKSFAKLTDKQVVDVQAKELIDSLKKEIKDTRANVVKEGIDAKSLDGLLEQVVARTMKSPGALRSVIDSIIKNKQLSTDLFDELNDVQNALKMDLQDIDGMGGRLMDEVSGKIYTKVRALIPEARDLGFEFSDDSLTVAMLASDDAIKVSTSRYFIKEVMEQFGVSPEMAREGYIPMSDIGIKLNNGDLSNYMTNKRGEELLFHPDIVKYVQEFTQHLSKDDSIGKVMDAYDSVQNYFKASVTAIWPAFHGRNALSNVFLMYNDIGLEVLNPAMHAASANMMNLERVTWQLKDDVLKGKATFADITAHNMKQVFTDNSGYNWTWGEMRHAIIDNVVAFNPRTLGMVDQKVFNKNEVAEYTEELFATGAKKVKQRLSKVNPLSTRNIAIQGGFKVGQSIEDYSRTLGFLANLKKVGDPMLAAQRMKLSLFDYNNLSKFEQTFMRRIVPFYTFTRKNLELQARTLLTNPSRIVQQVRAVQTMADVFGAEALTEEEKAKLPDWVRTGYDLVVGREGSHMTLLKTLGSPLEEIVSRTGAQANLGSISPLVTKPFELMSGYSFFYGKPISEITQADAFQRAPGWMKDYIGFAEVKYTDKEGVEQVHFTALKPENMYNLNSMPAVGRFFSEANRIDKSEGGTAKALNLFLGVGTVDVDLDREAQRKEEQMQKELENILDQAGLGYTFSRFSLNDEGKELAQ